MNSQRWREITSSFPCPDSKTDTANEPKVQEKQGLCKDSKAKPVEKELIPASSYNLEAKVTALQSLLHEKSRLIEEQGRLISELEKRLESSCVRSDGHSIKWRNNKESQKILENVEGLETKMNKLVTSLPRRISQLCDEYMKEFYKEGLDDAALPPHIRALWSKTPNIKPRSNLSSNLRELHQIKMTQQNQVKSMEEEDVQAKLTKLEHLVSDLKASFLQLLVDKLAAARRGQKCCGCDCNRNNVNGTEKG